LISGELATAVIPMLVAIRAHYDEVVGGVVTTSRSFNDVMYLETEFTADRAAMLSLYQ
jgi:hypothetical protein